MLNKSLHSELKIPKGEFFVKTGEQNFRIGEVQKGILRGFVINESGDEITTHFFKENDLISGNYIPKIPASINIQAMEDCLISVANYRDVFSHVNSDQALTDVILRNFEKLNESNQMRVEVLLSATAIEKYRWFLKEYPGVLNRVPHYYIASFLGMTPTQLSRTRKSFSQQM